MNGFNGLQNEVLLDLETYTYKCHDFLHVTSLRWKKLLKNMS